MDEHEHDHEYDYELRAPDHFVHRCCSIDQDARSRIVIGTALAGVMATLMRGILFGLPPIDPVAFSGSTAVILLVALLSSAAPARRAAQVSPLIALKAG